MERTAKYAGALVLWSALVWAGLHFTWPAAALPVEEIPPLPGIEQCGFENYEKCYAKAITQRQWAFTRRNEFADAYTDRTHHHLMIGAIAWLVPVALIFSVQYLLCRRKEKRNVV